jgi:hypothetical protein
MDTRREGLKEAAAVHRVIETGDRKYDRRRYVATRKGDEILSYSARSQTRNHSTYQNVKWPDAPRFIYHLRKLLFSLSNFLKSLHVSLTHFHTFALFHQISA